jgi:hypothetical protein
VSQSPQEGQQRHQRSKQDKELEDNYNALKQTLIQRLHDQRTTADGLISEYIAPSRHLRAAQATAAASSIYTTTSKQSRQQGKLDPKKLTDADVEQYLKQNGYIDQNAIISSNFENPYVDLDLWRFHDSWRRDPTARRALTILADFTLGQRTKNTLDINHDLDDEKQQQTALDAITNNPTYQAYRDELDRIDRDVDFDFNITAGFIQAKVFGRACILIQDDPESDMPVALKLVSSMRLGRVWIDEMTWKVVAVEYLDYQGLQSIIPAQKLIYLRNQDYAVSPNVYGYGYSDLEPVIDIAEINRQLWSVAIKEINKSMWAPYLIVKMNTKRASVMRKVADNLKPGIPFIHNQDIPDIKTIEMNHDLEKIMHEITQNEITMAYTIGVPTFLVGKEDVTNRATTASILDAWSKSKLDKERTWLKGIIEPQWSDRNLARLIKSGVVESNLPPDKPPVTAQQHIDPRTGKPTTLNVNPKTATFDFGGNGKKKKALAANAADNLEQMPQEQTSQPDNPSQAILKDTEISKLPFKIKRDFEPIVLDTLFETAQPIATLIQAGVIDETKAREVLHFEDIEARMKEAEAEAQRKAEMIAQGMGADLNNPADNKTKQQQQQQQQQNKNNPFAKGDNKQPQQQQKTGGTGQIGMQGIQTTQTALSASSEGSSSERGTSLYNSELRRRVHESQLQIHEEIRKAIREIAKN